MICSAVPPQADSSIYVLDMLDVARFWSRIEVRDKQLCWPWRFGANDGGYGEFRFLDGPKDLAHRVAYRIAYGLIPEGQVVRHSCDNRLCCNYDHLLLGEHADNVRDRVSRDRSAKGEDNGRTKLTEEEVRHIRASHFNNTKLADLYNVDPSTIRSIRKRETWTHIL